MPGESSLASWLVPLIVGGAGVAGGIYAANKQVGGLDKASDLQAKAAQDSLSAILQMWGIQRNDLAPYRAVGLAALKNLQNWNPHDMQRTNMSLADLSKFSADKVTLPPGLAALAPGSGSTWGGSSSGGAAAPGGATGAPGSPSGGLPGAPMTGPDFSDISTSGIHSRLGGVVGGALAGLGVGAGVKGVGGALLSGAKGALLGPAMVAGPAIGAIKGLFDNNNSDKDWASTSINRVSDWTWNTLVPAMKSGQISADDGLNAFNTVWGKWETQMTDPKSGIPNFNQDVAQRSIASQKQYFQPFFTLANQLKQAVPAGTGGAPVGNNLGGGIPEIFQGGF